MFTFREIKDQDGLIPAFQMRYQVYHNDPSLSHLLATHAGHMDVDGFDAYARHYGVYKFETGGHDILVGYIRIIKKDINPAMHRVLSGMANDLDIALPDRPQPLNSNAHFPHFTEAQLPHSGSAGLAVELFEPGRFIIAPEYRSLGLAQFIIECAMTVICAAHPNPIGLMNCRHLHKALYERYGFESLAVQESTAFPGNPWHLMMISGEGVAKRLPDLQARIGQFEATGQMHYAP
ncbi:MAG: GNAT family N-acetyltransferase [Saprospiraceae bacterium]|nr:GNAT family N-acetyltransferase [Saprospiraceae bacterium]